MITKLQQRFILEHVADPRRNATKAASRAGYASNCAKQAAYKLLKDAEIQHAIGEELTAHRERLELDLGMVIKGLMEVIEIARRAGQGAWQTQAMIRSYELIGKHLGMFTEKVDVNFDQKLMQVLEKGRSALLASSLSGT